MPVTPLLTGAFYAAHTGTSQVVLSQTAENIVRALDDFELDLGITYLDDQRLEGFRVLPLYRERYLLLARDSGALKSSEISWEQAARLPLCLLTPNMQNRRIIDTAFRKCGVRPQVIVETDSIFALYSHVRNAGLYSIVPHSLLALLQLDEGIAALPVLPQLTRGIGLIGLNQDPCPPLQMAAWKIAGQLDLQSIFDAGDNRRLSSHCGKALDEKIPLAQTSR